MDALYEAPRALFRDEVFALETQRLRLSVLKPSTCGKVATYFSKNRSFHEKWSQTHEDNYYTQSVQKDYLRYDSKQYKQGRLMPLWITTKDNPTVLIGRVSYFNFAFGGMMSCSIGYHLDSEFVGKGYMTEAIKASSEFLFEELGIHRIEAYVMPDNKKSLALIERCGFSNEGLRHSYMHINGKWEDHIGFYLLKP